MRSSSVLEWEIAAYFYHDSMFVRSGIRSLAIPDHLIRDSRSSHSRFQIISFAITPARHLLLLRIEPLLLVHRKVGAQLG